jgi:hypothetical protein
MKTEPRLTHAGNAPELSSLNAELEPAGEISSVSERRWRQFTTVSALLIEIPLALALIAAALLATLPSLVWD